MAIYVYSHVVIMDTIAADLAVHLVTRLNEYNSAFITNIES